MASLREVRNRISAIKSTRQITGAMKMVAASKLHRTQQIIIHLRQYACYLGEFLSEVNRQTPFTKKHQLTSDRGVKSVLLIPIASNKGLCGTYNAVVIKRTLQRIGILEKNHIDYTLWLAGKKLSQYFLKGQFEINKTWHDAVDSLTYEKAVEIANEAASLFLAGEIDQVDIIYHKFKNAVTQELVLEQLLPVPLSDILPAQDPMSDFVDHTLIDEPSTTDQAVPEQYGYILEPNRDELLDTLVHRYLYFHLFRILVDSAASEHGARMTSMHKATDNADKLLRELTLSYNKARQAMITREIMEIVGGA